MTRHLARLVEWLCALWLVFLAGLGVWLVLDIDRFALLAAEHSGMPIQWHTVDADQWYGFWALSVAYLAIGFLAVVNLLRAFRRFARGAWFDVTNSRMLRRFAALLMIQAVAKPLVYAASTVVLSWRHPAGEGVLSISVGSQEAIMLVAGLIMWVLSDLLVIGMRAETENQQFV